VFLEGPAVDGASVIVLDRRSGTSTLRSLDLNGSALAEPLFGGAETRAAISDETGAVIGGALAGLYPRYEFFDETLSAEARSLRASFPGQAVHVSGFSAGKKRILLRVEGGIEPGRYVVFDREARSLIPVAPSRPSIIREDMGEVVTIEYPARDGQKIGAVLTWPARVPAEQRRMLPAVVLPHNEPDGYDDVGYDWLAQFLANEGYAVLQPNYRGSGGQGASFRAAGYDQFGRIMQHDVTDGVFELAKAGWIDEDRVCIVGQGWGGYVALMGAAVTPNRYRCAVSIGGITDLPDFIKRRAEGDVRYSDYYTKWVRLLGDTDANRTNQQRYSPVNLARQFQAKVLLIHGDNDSFSPDRQSRRMESALKAAGKEVRFVLIPRDSENLLYPESRHKVQREVSAFLAANLGPRPPTAQGAVAQLPP
jgi:dipeptidyl aminopeptidase/acylaminoacyl peptidase